jgi:DNA-binding response OmpR family regulator
MAQGAPSHRRSRVTTIPPGQPLIAIVEDDREMREWLADIMRAAKFQVSLAPNGLRLVSALQIDRPDLIVLDVNLSWIDGFELCRALKKNPTFADIPVVFLSGRTAPSDIQAGLACGAVDYLCKPVDGRTLLARIRELVQTRQPS